MCEGYEFVVTALAIRHPSANLKIGSSNRLYYLEIAAR